MFNHLIARLFICLFFILGFAHLSFAQATIFPSYGSGEISPRVIGGQEVSSESVYPWMAIIHVDFPGNKIGRCGATIVDEQWVLTAAHCFYYNDILITDTAKISLTTGEYDISQQSSSEHQRAASELIIHKDFDITDQFLKNDIALIRLDNVAQGASLIALGSVTVSNNIDLPGDTLKVMGWGLVKTQSSNVMPSVLNAAELKNIALSKCRAVYSGLTDAHLCAGFYDEGGVDSCAGDSGGPLVFNDGGQWVQVGIVSFGRGCAQAEKPGIYTNVTKYIPWIQSTINAKKSMMRLAIIEGPSVALVAGSGNLAATSSGVKPSAVVVTSRGGSGGGGSLNLSYLLSLVLALIIMRKLAI